MSANAPDSFGAMVHFTIKDDNADDEGDAELSNFDRWQLGPAPFVNWDVNHQRLRGIPDHSDFACGAFALGTPMHAGKRHPLPILPSFGGAHS
ncbi:hypothetical protein QBC36DRAFT_351636 [Triangularia setosa]|uniref:Uncharacterized protein n=1 Tax=Triangularia setosa TaxID=2587417 RepID=A0AAN7A7A8_9PEZI|nr:hypothetical protein QBC36DRAFT_351636 [Podospora setosa]